MMILVVMVVGVSMMVYFFIGILDFLCDFGGDWSWESQVVRNRVGVVMDVVLDGRVCCFWWWGGWWCH